MPFLTVKLSPGVRSEQTPLLLQAGIVQSNNIRWRDGLPEKLGGYRKFYYSIPGVSAPFTSLPLAGPIREIWPWADFNAALHLAAGGDRGVYISTSQRLNITPQFNVKNVAPTFVTTVGSSVVTILNVDGNVTTNLVGSVVVDNYVAVGGLILFGGYPIYQVVDATTVRIRAAVNATAAVAAPGGGVVSTFSTSSGSEICTVTLPNHGFSAGRAYFALPTTLTGSSNAAASVPDVVVQGTYTILSVIDANTFTIGLGNSAYNAVGPIAENSAHVKLTTWVVPSPDVPSTGWGQGNYGHDNWGGGGVVLVPATGTPVTAANLGLPTLDWCLTNFGETLIAQFAGGGFFKWAVTSGYGVAQPIPQAPAAAEGFFLAMPQQQLVAYGASPGASTVQDPMLVRWCDNALYTDWVASVANQAGSYRLTRGSKIIGAVQAPMQAMLWTDIGLWLMTYVGYPDVWGFQEVAQECGLISKKAAGVSGGQVFWMSRDKFWTFQGGQVQPLACEVWDVVFQNLNLNLVDRIRCGVNSGFDEVWWFYPSSRTDITKYPTALQENDSYVKFNRVTGEWDYGTPVDVFGGGASGGLMISDWVDNNVFGHPISAMTQADGVSSQMMWQEMARDADTGPMHWWFRTGLFALSEGEDFIFVDRCRPDFRWRKFLDALTPTPPTLPAQVQISLYTQDDSDNPSKPPTVYGPFVCTDVSGAFDPRARGRYFSLKVEGNDLGSFVRLGGVKFRFSPDGRAG